MPALIDVNKVINFIRDIKRLYFMKKANRLAALTGHRYMVVRFAGKLFIWKKSDIKRLIATRKFAKGVRIEDVEKMAIHITPLDIKRIK